MPRILIQAGHSDRYPPFAPNGGGAPQEAEWTAQAAAALAALLAPQGVETVLVGSWYDQVLQRVLPPPPEVGQDYALFLALHYDADVYPDHTGCFGDHYRPEQLGSNDPRAASTNPNAAEEDRFLALWEAHYSAALGIPVRSQRRNPNTWDYYAYRDTTAATPGVLLELGVGQGQDHDTLFNRLDEVAAAVATPLCSWLAVVSPPPALTPEQQAILDKMAALPAGADAIDVWLSRLGRTAEIGRLLDRSRVSVSYRRQLAQELQRMNDNA